MPDGRFTSTNVTIKMLLAFAYDVREHQILGGPDWLGTERYDIEAKAGSSVAEMNDVRLMLRALLDDRFGLKIRRETKEQPIFEIFAEKGGVKLERATVNPRRRENKVRIGADRFDAESTTMSDLERILSNELGRSVVDRTGLQGAYHVSLTWAQGDHRGGPRSPVNERAFLTALREQAGLNLEPHSGPIDVLVVDRAEKPTASH
jgi:uncharacterized protein (TIGR03435 family)